MAPAKRSRPAADGDRDEEEIISVQQASSNLRQTGAQRKKVRLSAGANQDNEVSDGDIVARRKEADTTLPESTQFEIERDGDFEHLAQADNDDERATQAILARQETIGENHAAENGIIESVTMVNFMCHERLHVTLGPLINFLIGKNGSGKSAILTAITLCLGAKASTTNRGGSLKSFIKEGRDQANLIIKLKNTGEDAYQPDTYGDSIIVERYFTRSGTSGFKLKSANGKIMSTKKADVEDVIEYFQMQIDNPMNVLSQDAARQFLNASSAAQKYKFFIKGVQLEQLSNDYALMWETVDNIQIKLQSKAESIAVLEKKATAAKQKAKTVAEHESLRQLSRTLTRQAAWAQVEEQERRLLDRNTRRDQEQLRVQEAEQAAIAKDTAYEQTNEAVARTQGIVDTMREELAPFQEEEAKSKAEYDQSYKEVQQAHTQQREIKDLLGTTQRKIDNFNGEIQKEQMKLDSLNGGADVRKQDELRQAQKSASQADEELQNITATIMTSEKRLKEAANAASNLQEPLEAKRREINQVEARLNGLNRDRDQGMAGFDPKMPELLRMIESDRGFNERPVGPIGQHVKLLKPIWSTILEKSIGSLLSGFIVTSKNDQVRLSNMMRRVGIEYCPIVIGNHSRIDTTNHEPEEHFSTILRVLDIDNDLVRRQLVINQAIEQTLLIEDRGEAYKVMFEGPKPRNVRQCFCLHDTKRGWGLRLGWNRGGADQSTSPIQPPPPTRKPRMKTDVESQISYQRELINQLNGDYSELEKRRRLLEQDVQKAQRALTQHRRDIRNLEVKKQRADDEVERIQTELDGLTPDDGRLQVLKEYLGAAEVELRLHQSSYGDAGLAKEKHSAVSVALKRVLNSAKLAVAEQAAKIKKAEDKTGRLSQARQLALQEKNIAYDAIHAANVELEKITHKRDQQASVVENFIGEASRICPRVPIDAGETTSSIDAKLASLSRTLREHSRRQGGTDEEIMRAAVAAEQEHQRGRQQLGDMRALETQLKETLMDRVDRWRKFQRFISARSRMNFIYLLSERGFRGRLSLDHQARLLDLQVEPDDTTRSAAGRQTKTLSGGEKSFSSICLLLSLWEAMGAPLRCLDEFDVFMDNVNRDVSLKMIIGAARRSVGRQFILITPNGIGGGVEHGRDVKIIQLGDPRQQRLADL